MTKWSSKLFYSRLLWFILFTLTISVVFGGIYYSLFLNKIDSFGYDWNDIENEKLKTFDFWYFSWVTQTTVGYGDISPKSTFGKFLACSQIFIFWVTALTFAVLADEKDIRCILIPGKKCY